MSSRSLTRIASLERSSKEQEDTMKTIEDKLTQAIEVGATNADATRRVEGMLVQLMKGINLPFQGLSETLGNSETGAGASVLQKELNVQSQGTPGTAGEEGQEDGDVGVDWDRQIPEADCVAEEKLTNDVLGTEDDANEDAASAQDIPAMLSQSRLHRKEVHSMREKLGRISSRKDSAVYSPDALDTPDTAAKTATKTRGGLRVKEPQQKTAPKHNKLDEVTRADRKKRKNDDVTNKTYVNNLPEVSAKLGRRIDNDLSVVRKPSFLLVLSIQGTLLDAIPNSEKYESTNLRKSYQSGVRRYIFRPLMAEFLDRCFLRFTVAFLGNGDEMYMREVCDILYQQCSSKELWTSNFNVGAPAHESLCKSHNNFISGEVGQNAVIDHFAELGRDLGTIYVLPRVGKGTVRRDTSNTLWSSVFEARDLVHNGEDDGYLLQTLWPRLERIADTHDRLDTTRQKFVDNSQSSLQVCSGKVDGPCISFIL